MQDPNEDTEWNDVLRAKGIIPEKPKENEIGEDEIIAMMEKTIKVRSGGKSMTHHTWTYILLEHSGTSLEHFKALWNTL